MSSYNKKKNTTQPGSLTLCLNSAEGRLQLVLGRVDSSPGSSSLPGSSDSSCSPGLSSSLGLLNSLGSSGSPAPCVSPKLEILAVQDWSAVAQGAELLAPALQQMLANLKLEARHIGRLAVVTGPGSFTGLRLACSTAAALSRGLGAGQVGLEYLPLLAAGVARLGLANGAGAVQDNVPYCKNAGNGYGKDSECKAQEIWVLTHARKGLVYAQGFVPATYRQGVSAYGAFAHGTTAALCGLRELCELKVLDIPAVYELLRERGSRFLSAGSLPGFGWIVGSGLTNNYAELAALNRPAEVSRDLSTEQSVEQLAEQFHDQSATLSSSDQPAAQSDVQPAAQSDVQPAGQFYAEPGGGHSWHLLPGVLDQPLPAVFLQAALAAPRAMQDLQPLYVRPSDAEENLGQIASGLGLDENFAKQRLAALLRE